MHEYLLFYLLIKLDDIRKLFISNYGITFLSIIVSIFYVLITFGIDNSGLIKINNQELVDNVINRSKKCLKIVVVVFAMQMVFNVIGTLIPTTGETVAIYVASKTYNSKTIDVLKNIDPKIAKILDLKFNKWLEKNLPSDEKNK